ncbi:MAG TPA: NAD-dependent epimerase/dehydratase family protein, partial [Blastocatellia bacterium]|nr:NAD-dependent epimerase/dehydratase family protein [Blastocatellia bacterium]
MERLKILVTGGAGFIGSHLVDALVARGHRVRILDAVAPQVHVTGEPQYLNPEAEFIRGDVCDPAALDGAVEGVDVVYHQAAEVGVGQSMYEIRKFVRANDLGTAVLLEALVKRRSQIRKLIVASSMSIYGEGAYRNADGEIVYPPIRPANQLVERQWEPLCPRTGAVLTPAGTTEEKPLVPTSVYAVTKQDQEQFCLV